MYDIPHHKKKHTFKGDRVKKKEEKEREKERAMKEQNTPGIIIDGETGKKGYVYRQMELPAQKMTEEWEENIRKRIHPHISTLVANLGDVERVTDIHNRAFLTAPDPYAAITPGDVRRLILCPRTVVLIGQIWGSQDCGFIIINFEEHCSDTEVERIDKLQKTGIHPKLLPEDSYESAFISGMGVLPQWQRKGVGTTLGIKSWDILKAYGVQKLACEVYEGNKASYNLIVSMGFDEKERIVYWADGRMQQLRRL